MTEDLLYDKDGLFHNIVKQSAVFAGRYEVLVNGPSDLNNGNLLNGIELPAGKYPLVAGLPPTSIPSNRWEMFSFRLLFLCSSVSDGTNQLRQRDANTNTSKRRGSHDWRDMNGSATAFMLALQELQEQMRNRLMLDERNPWRITRVSNMQKDKVSGVVLQFNCGIAAMCGQEEIDTTKVVIPTVLKNGTGSSGGAGWDPAGYMPGGRFDAEYGKAATMPEGYVSYDANFSTVGAGMVAVYTEAGVLIDWNDGKGLQQYPNGQLVRKKYPEYEPARVTIWHDHSPKWVLVNTDGTFGPQLANITGTLPNSMENFDVSQTFLEAMPIITSTKMINYGLLNSRLSKEVIDAALQSIIDNGIEYGSVDIRTNPRMVPDVALVSAVKGLHWEVFYYQTV